MTDSELLITVNDGKMTVAWTLKVVANCKVCFVYITILTVRLARGEQRKPIVDDIYYT